MDNERNYNCVSIIEQVPKVKRQNVYISELNRLKYGITANTVVRSNVRNSLVHRAIKIVYNAFSIAQHP